MNTNFPPIYYARAAEHVLLLIGEFEREVFMSCNPAPPADKANTGMTLGDTDMEPASSECLCPLHLMANALTAILLACGSDREASRQYERQRRRRDRIICPAHRRERTSKSGMHWASRPRPARWRSSDMLPKPSRGARKASRYPRPLTRACCRFRGHRYKVFNGTGELE